MKIIGFVCLEKLSIEKGDKYCPGRDKKTHGRDKKTHGRDKKTNGRDKKTHPHLPLKRELRLLLALNKPPLK